jgi:hypothetical protein
MLFSGIKYLKFSKAKKNQRSIFQEGYKHRYYDHHYETGEKSNAKIQLAIQLEQETHK